MSPESEEPSARERGGRGVTERPLPPRWEWRVFQRNFAAPNPVEEPGQSVSDEAYLLSLVSPHNVRVRDGRLVIKHLERQEESGLELWRTIVDAAFPIDDEVLAAAYAAWRVAPPANGMHLHSLADLVNNLVVPHRELRVVSVTKRQIPISMGPCRGERAQITVGRHVWNTVQFEDGDSENVHAALRGLALDASVNENYPAALKRILGFPDHSSLPTAASHR